MASPYFILLSYINMLTADSTMHLSELRTLIGPKKGVCANIMCFFLIIVVETIADIYAVPEIIEMASGLIEACG